MLRFKRYISQVQDEEPPVHIPDADHEHTFKGDLYHGTTKPYKKLKATKTQGKGLPEPTAVSFATRRETAGQFGPHIFHVKVNAKVGDAELFMKRARQHMKNGMSDDDASAVTQAEFKSKGYHGVRWGHREVALWDKHDSAKLQTNNSRSRKTSR